MDKNRFIRILNSEMQLATGCTEPAAVALAAAEAVRVLGSVPERLEVSASAGILKNAMAAGIPGTDYTGMSYAAAIGAMGGDPERKLEVINGVPAEKLAMAEAFVRDGNVSVAKADTALKLYIDVTAYGEGHSGRAVIRNLHTNVALLQRDDTILRESDETAAEGSKGSDAVSPEEIERYLTMHKIWSYCAEEMDPVHDPIDRIRSAVEINRRVSEEGMRKDYGLAVGRRLQESCRDGIMTMDMTTYAMITTAAASDARMAGAPLSVVTNSGSGNQGIVATMPVVAAAHWLKSGEERLLRAAAISHLVTIYIKSKFGRLSNLCGATVAATGASCAIAYLLGGGYDAVCNAVHNMIGNLTGMVCDGAKADCSLKISSCVNAAVQAAILAVQGVRVQSTDGVVAQDVEDTIRNFAVLSNQGTGDQVILDLMLKKQNSHE